jgi:hypothetical protein
VVLLLVHPALFLVAMVAVGDSGERYGDVPASEAVPAVGYRRRRRAHAVGRRGWSTIQLINNPGLISETNVGQLIDRLPASISWRWTAVREQFVLMRRHCARRLA